MRGIDLSCWQEKVNYLELKAQGIEFAIIRCGFGKNISQKDSKFEDHYAGLKYAGIKIGAYLYSYASTIEGAKAEAKNCLEFIKNKKFDLPIFYDLEDAKTTGNANNETITEMAKVFCEEIIKEGYQAGVYANLNWFKNKLNVKELEKYNIWLAQWGVEKHNADFKVDIWQYTSKGKIKGINGNVDLDVSYTQYGDKVVNNSNNVDIEQMARDVIAGKYGNGQERKNKLGNLYNEVQKRVNEILSNKVSQETLNIEELARAVIRGEYGNGQERKDKLGNIYNQVQARVNEILLGKSW